MTSSRRGIFIALASIVAAARLKAAQTLVRGAALFVPAVTNNAVEIIRAGSATKALADIGASLRLDQLTNPQRLELNVDWTKDPNVSTGGGGLAQAPRQLTLTNGNQYIFDPVSALPSKHLLFVNGLFYFPGDDYTVSAGIITAKHEAMLDPNAKVIIAL